MEARLRPSEKLSRSTAVDRSRAILSTIAALAASPPASGQETRPGEAAEPASTAERAETGLDLDGRLDLRYRYRSVPGDARDQDLYGSFAARAVLPGTGETGLRVEASGSFVWDLDDFGGAGGPFQGLSDTFDERFHAYLYEAYGEVDPAGPVSKLRAGRQVLWREEGIRFDGLYAEGRSFGGIDVSLYGGVPVHYYESSRAGDLVAGAGLSVRPGSRLRVTLDGIYVRDRRDVPGVPSVEGDFLTALGVEWIPEPRLRARGSFSLLDGKERRETAELAFFDPASRLRLAARVLRQNDITEVPVTEFSPFVATLGVLEPYLQFQVDGGFPIAGPLDFAAGYARRRLIEGADEGLFNHEFDHGYAMATLGSFPAKGASVFVRGDGWNGGGRDLASVGGGVEARLGARKEWRAEIGTDYALYRVDLLTGDERFRDRLYYARVRRRIGEALDLGLGYRDEVDDLDRYHVADATLGVRF